MLLILVGLSAARAEGPDIRVIDGDTFEATGGDGQRHRYRLWGIDAPEIGEVCGDGWQAGRQASQGLALLLSNENMTCLDLGRDRYDRVITKCWVEGHDVAELMVKQGLAWDWPRYSGKAYAEAESVARETLRGLWWHQCEWGRI